MLQQSCVYVVYPHLLSTFASITTAEQPTLASLLTRLELATERLEDLSLSGNLAGGGAAGRAVGRAIRKNVDAIQATVPASVESYDEIINGSLKRYLEHSEVIGDLVKEQSLAVQRLFQIQRQFILVAAQSKKPDFESATFSELIGPTQQAMNTICAYRNDNRGSPLFNHLSTVSEGISALGWITVEPAPAPYVGEMKDSAHFYANRVLKDYKDTDVKHVEWANAFMSILEELQSYVKSYHTTGLVWNPNGKDVQEVAASLSTSPSNSGKRPRPPVPPRHDRAQSAAGEAASSAGQDASAPSRAALFSALNAGEGITAGLRKVNKSEMTHKNPELRGTSVVPAASTSAKPATTSTTQPKRPPRTVLEGKKWIVENYNGEQVLLDKIERDHAVYIFQCTNATITVKGKAAAVTIDHCRKSGIVVDSVMSNLEVIAGQSVQLQVSGHVETIVVDNTDSAQIYISPESMGVQLLTSKSTSVNVLFAEKSSDDYTEKAIPEQFLSKIVNGKVVTEPVVRI
ncbi:adenylate cyclase associated N terminal-domain-containing protein [Syncephalis pseudoplumigaleata]|uniref:Adenylyl cyclase-associated protein n=1 Tax=Syncephalis pseudoplumigaleata TaxID=1712513 RepID=A0A4P9Z2W8_9FUNG|nr:adenylate cyclase associated N terminal-domain-containing protein [Syncephalis pseudoplumigaleata]|eukprot:RKP26766.1 adenylate cyclase associated N terminal-domain-containing protein [Syncephalis pseudoplumigaleata]